MIGRRVYTNDHGKLPPMRPGDYALTHDGDWWAVLPDGTFGRLTDHIVTEHDDGTITVEPSIYFDEKWHGWLIHGEWRDS